MNTAYPELQQAFEKMILSASGWRKVFAQSGSENDGAPEISAADRDIVFFAAQSFAEFLQAEFPAIRTVVIARDSRPTGEALLKEAVTAFTAAFPPPSLGEAAPLAGAEAEVHVMIDEKNSDRLCGFFTLSAHQITTEKIARKDRRDDPKNGSIAGSLEGHPSLLLGKFALDKDYQGSKVSSVLMHFVYQAFLASLQYSGARYLVAEVREDALRRV